MRREHAVQSLPYALRGVFRRARSRQRFLRDHVRSLSEPVRLGPALTAVGVQPYSVWFEPLGVLVSPPQSTEALAREWRPVAIPPVPSDEALFLSRDDIIAIRISDAKVAVVSVAEEILLAGWPVSLAGPHTDALVEYAQSIGLVCRGGYFGEYRRPYFVNAVARSTVQAGTRLESETWIPVSIRDRVAWLERALRPVISWR